MIKGYLIYIGIFFLIGLFSGYLLRNINFLKILAIFIILPQILVVLSALNYWTSTIPFLVGGFIAFFRTQNE
jgi:hypothetical protein